MHTDRFRKLRKDSLSNFFDKKEVSSVWRKIVRGQLRSLNFKDLYDHYDFNYNIEDRATAIRNEILNGTYREVQGTQYIIHDDITGIKGH